MNDDPMERGAAEYQVILVAEDKEDDITLLGRAFQNAEITNPIHIVRDGKECIEYLLGKGKYANRDEYPIPVLLLLDLKMPHIDGFAVLKWIRAELSLKRLPVVVLTTSEDIFDINRAYELGANSFLVKTLDIQSFSDLVEQVSRYWLHFSRAPEAERPPRLPAKPKTES